MSQKTHHNIDKSSVQSILLDKNYFTEKQAKTKIKNLGYEPLKFHETEAYYRFRIQNPAMFLKLRSKKIQEGILFVIGVKK